MFEVLEMNGTGQSNSHGKWAFICCAYKPPLISVQSICSYQTISSQATPRGPFKRLISKIQKTDHIISLHNSKIIIICLILNIGLDLSFQIKLTFISKSKSEITICSPLSNRHIKLFLGCYFIM